MSFFQSPYGLSEAGASAAAAFFLFLPLSAARAGTASSTARASSVAAAAVGRDEGSFMATFSGWRASGGRRGEDTRRGLARAGGCDRRGISWHRRPETARRTRPRGREAAGAKSGE